MDIMSQSETGMRVPQKPHVATACSAKNVRSRRAIPVALAPGLLFLARLRSGLFVMSTSVYKVTLTRD